jgi:hypothetical protein
MPRAICKYCGCRIQWIRTVNGRMMPCEMNRLVIIDQNGETHSGYESHYAHCARAEIARRQHIKRRMIRNANLYSRQ